MLPLTPTPSPARGEGRRGRSLPQISLPSPLAGEGSGVRGHSVTALESHVAISQIILKSSTIVHRRCRVNVSGLVTPSPVGVAMLYER